MQEAITTLTTLDYVGIFGGILLGIAAFKTIVTALEWLANKLGIRFKFIEDKKADHNLLQQTVDAVNKIEKQMRVDEEEYTKKDTLIEEKIESLNSEIKNLSELSNSVLEKIGDISNNSKLYKKAVVEMLYGTISKQCDYYINELKGIPTSEVRWFTNRFELYQSMGGNHGLERKVQYCLDKLPIIPD